MAREGLMDDSGYMGFEECSNYESCTDNFVAELLEPYDVESIEELVQNSYNKGRADCLKEAQRFADQESYKEGYKRGLAKGRADAIEELKSKADCDRCYECAMADANLDCMLGLKEQKNE